MRDYETFEDAGIEQESRLTELRIKRITNANPVDYYKNPGEHCKWCGEFTGVTRRFCDTECRDEWEKYGE